MTDARKIDSQVFDERTMEALYKLISKKELDEMGGTIAIGKEANVFRATAPEDQERAVKIYRIETSSFKNMMPYLQGDPRFNVKNNKRDIVYEWTKKEYRNLLRLWKAGVRVPRPYAHYRNVFIMELIQTPEGSPAPTLQKAPPEDMQQVYDKVMDNLQKMYAAGFVYADASEYNIILPTPDDPVLIDFGQAVLKEIPGAATYLHRDCGVIAKFFAKHDIDTDSEKVRAFITKPQPLNKTKTTTLRTNSNA